MNTPIHEIRITHGMSHIMRVPKSVGSNPGFSIIKAGIAFESPALVMVPAADAHDCIALFSRMVYPPNQRGRIFCSPAKMEYARMHEVIATPRLQPVLSET